jgi:hypothetical protein
MNIPPNKSVETNRRPGLPLNDRWEFGRAFHAPTYLSAAVAHLCVSCDREIKGSVPVNR